MPKKRQPHYEGSRSFHEEFVADNLKTAKTELTRANQRGCSGAGLENLIESSRSVARARTHLVSIGPLEGKRSKKLWGAISKVEKNVAQAVTKMKTCF